MIKYILECVSGQRLSKWRMLCLASLLLAQPVFAQTIALGNSYSVFDSFILVRTGASDIQNCTNLRDAIDNTSGVRTIKLPPATYDCGTNSLTVPSNTTLKGSGQKNTRIIGQSPPLEPVIDLPFQAELYNLSVENTLINSFDESGVRAVRAQPGSVMNHVTIISQGENNSANIGIALNAGSSPEAEVVMNHVTIRVSNASSSNVGIFAFATVMARINDINILTLGPGSIAISALNGVPFLTIRNSVLSGETFAILGNTGSTPRFEVTHSQLIGSVVVDTGTTTCFRAYDENLIELSEACTPIP